MRSLIFVLATLITGNACSALLKDIYLALSPDSVHAKWIGIAGFFINAAVICGAFYVARAHVPGKD